MQLQRTKNDITVICRSGDHCTCYSGLRSAGAGMKQIYDNKHQKEKLSQVTKNNDSLQLNSNIL